MNQAAVVAAVGTIAVALGSVLGADPAIVGMRAGVRPGPDPTAAVLAATLLRVPVVASAPSSPWPA